MPIVCAIKFRGTSKAYYFAPGEIQDLQVDDRVIVETSRGREMGRVMNPAIEVDEQEIVGQLKPILRQAGSADLLAAERFRGREADAMRRCKEEVARFDLPMRIVRAEYNFDGTRLTCYFTSEQRVDFRELVRELAPIFSTRIELRQIGVRDEAKLLGGLGRCGRALCCATWLTEFCPVSIRMAKQQDLPLSPMEISGLCGRLLCCLGYENEYYREIKSRFPKVGKMVSTPYGRCKVVKVNVLSETVTILLEDGSTAELTAEQLAKGASPGPAAEREPSHLTQAQREALDAVIGNATPASRDSSAGRGQKAKAQPAGETAKRALKRSRARGRPRSRVSSGRRERTPEGSNQHRARPEAQSEGETSTRARRPKRRAKKRGEKARTTGDKANS